jgi:N-acetylglucosamine-6-phosphate deacetylase
MKTLISILTGIFLFGTNSNNGLMEIDGILYSDMGNVTIKSVDGNISEISRIETQGKSEELFVAPGLIDVQINGYMGVDFSGPGLTIEGIRKATKALWKVGVTTYFPTIITSDIDRIKENFAVLAAAKNDPEIGKSIAGFHLEGPYISPVKGFRGAHLEKYIKLPDWKEFQEIQKAANNGIKLITLAPELEGAISFIQKCVANGVVVSLGHHNGSAKDIQQAVDAGAKMATHLGNGCAITIHCGHNFLMIELHQVSLLMDFI